MDITTMADAALLEEFARLVSDNARGAGNNIDAVEAEILRRMGAEPTRPDDNTTG